LKFLGRSVLQKLPDVSRIPVPSPLKSGFRPRRTDIASQVFIRTKLFEQLRESLKIVGLAKNEAVHSVVNQFGNAGILGGNDGQAARHGFRNRQSEGIFPAWTDVKISGRIEIQNISARGLKTATLRNAQGVCRFKEKIRGIIPGRNHENGEFSKDAYGTKNGFKSFDAPIVSNQEQHEITLLNFPPQAGFVT